MTGRDAGSLLNAKSGGGRMDFVTVCICTYRREAVMEAIMSVGSQINVCSVLAGILVIDNDETDVLRSRIMALAPLLPCPIDYVHAPAKNISIARNAAIKAVKTRWLAFLDDDEVATETWLQNLLEMRSEAEVVVGPSVAQYDKSMPGWVFRCDFHSARMGVASSNAYSGNVLIDLEFVDRFNCGFIVALGLTGGEDTIFFRQLEQYGARFAYHPNAVVHEIVPFVRANMRWVLRRMFRSGQTHGLACKMFEGRRFALLWLTASVKLLASATMALFTLPGSDYSRKWTARAAMHAGALAYALRPKILQEYA